jgi:hypothetical protein
VEITYVQAGTTPATEATIGFGKDGKTVSCTARYDVAQTKLTAAKTGFGDGGAPTSGGVEAAGKQGGIPKACIDKYGPTVTKDQCDGLCSQRGVDCRPS